MAARAGLAPWSTGYKRLSNESHAQGFIPGHGFLAARPSEWTKDVKKPKGRWLTDSKTGVKYYVTSKDIEELTRTANSLDASGNYKFVPDTLFMKFIADNNISAEDGMAAYVEESFNGKSKGKVWDTDGAGHIIRLEYNDYTQVMRVYFRKGAICVYFRVPMVVFGELYALAQSKITTAHTFDGNERSALGVRFWDLVRIRGSLYGGQFRFTYMQGNSDYMSDYVPSANDRGRPRKYFLMDDEKLAKLTFNKLKELDPDAWKEVRAKAYMMARSPFLEAFAAERGKIEKPQRTKLTNLEIEQYLFDLSDKTEKEKAELNSMSRQKYLYDNKIPYKRQPGYVDWEFANKFNRDYKFEKDEKIRYRQTPIFNTIIQPGSVADLRLKAFDKLTKLRETQFKKANNKYWETLKKARAKLLADPELIAESKRLYEKEIAKGREYAKNFELDATQEEMLTKKYQRKVPLASTADNDWEAVSDYLDQMEEYYGPYNMKLLKQNIKKHGYENFVLNATTDDDKDLFETPAVLAHASNDTSTLKKIHAAFKQGYNKLSTSGKNTYNKIKGSTKAETDFLREHYLASWNVLPDDYYNDNL